jgi:predicted lipid-binding transport protein (Tim44 family)
MPALFDPVNIVLLAAAIFIAWRFMLVLGQRDGGTRPRPDLAIPSADKADSLSPSDNPKIPMQEPEVMAPAWKGFAEEGSTLAKGIDAIAKASPDFAVPSFLAGAKQAYEMILEAYAKGDRQALRPLLSKEVYDGFSAAIADREQKGQSKVFQFVGVKSATIKQAAMAGRNAQITVQFIGEMISATLAPGGETLDGDPKLIREDLDEWMYERDTSSRDPNWKLAGTADGDI